MLYLYPQLLQLRRYTYAIPGVTGQTDPPRPTLSWRVVRTHQSIPSVYLACHLARIGILVCDSFCDCQVRTFGGVVRPRQLKVGGGGGYVLPTTPVHPLHHITLYYRGSGENGLSLHKRWSLAARTFSRSKRTYETFHRKIVFSK